jgi:Resolvase, N terminal domain
VPRPWWQRAIAGERLPKEAFRRQPKCHGTVEDHRNIALDVRELICKRVFGQPVGSVFRLNLRFPWLRMMRLNSSTLDLELVTGRTITVPLVWASCGVMTATVYREKVSGARTSSSQGRLLSTLLAAIAEFERELIRERTPMASSSVASASCRTTSEGLKEGDGGRLARP